MKEIKFLFKKMAIYEPMMFLLIVLYGLFVGIKPFLWIISPAYILKNHSQNPEALVGFFIGLILISSLVSFFDSFIMGNYRMRMNNVRYKLMNMVTRYALYLPYAKKKEKAESEKINNAKKATEGPFLGGGGLMMNFPQVLALIISIGGFLWIFLRMDTYVVVSTIVLSIISSAIAYRVPKIYGDYWARMSPAWNRFSKLNNELRSPLSKQDILIFDIRNLFKTYYKKTNENRIGELKLTHDKTMKVFSLAKVFSLVRDLIIIYWLMTSLLRGKIDLADFYVFFTAVLAFVNFNNEVMWIFSDFTTNLTIFRPFLKIIDVYKNDKKAYYSESLEIRFDHVSFAYPGTEDLVLKDINVTIKDGESIALVGENGAGKSTLAMLLAGFYEPTEGRILINGKDRKDSKLDYKKLVSAVFQDSSLLPFSIRENILLEESDKDLADIYKKTKLDKIIDGFDKKDEQTLLRILDDKGVDLSGGQKQRLFLARAIAKENTKLLILDEPTAQLDALNERDLYYLYDELTEGKSSVFISHRLASTRFCDRIIYLKDGHIRSSGTHEELMEKDPDYRDLYELQAKSYKEAL